MESQTSTAVFPPMNGDSHYSQFSFLCPLSGYCPYDHKVSEKSHKTMKAAKQQSSKHHPSFTGRASERATSRSEEVCRGFSFLFFDIILRWLNHFHPKMVKC